MEERPYTIRDVIKEFFDGKDYFHEECHCKIGHIWIAKHTGYYTLTVEPREGGQYEIAVRIWHPEKREWQGYKVNAFNDIGNHHFLGVNTGGH